MPLLVKPIQISQGFSRTIYFYTPIIIDMPGNTHSNEKLLDKYLCAPLSIFATLQRVIKVTGNFGWSAKATTHRRYRTSNACQIEHHQHGYVLIRPFGRSLKVLLNVLNVQRDISSFFLLAQSRYSQWRCGIIFSKSCNESGCISWIYWNNLIQEKFAQIKRWMWGHKGYIV